LRASIEAGDLVPGTFIDQNHISAELGISRMPLRDAMIQLELEGFVDVLPRRGVRVRRLTLDDVRHLYEIIGALEGAALLSSPDGIDPGDLIRMDSLNREMSSALESGDFDTYYSRNVDFHRVFLSCTTSHVNAHSYQSGRTGRSGSMVNCSISCWRERREKRPTSCAMCTGRSRFRSPS
jgi:DNA-binding GntR family transcriptional regulator